MNYRALTFAGIFVLSLVVILNSFTIKKPVKIKDEGKGLFTAYCATCHMLPDPASLTKEIWKDHVLPVMASRMGIIYPNYDPLRGLSDEEDESFIYLENIDPEKFTFKPYILKSDVPLKSLTLEKADIDGDGDMDIIAGNFAQSPGPVPLDLDKKWKSAKYGLTIFKNQLYQPKK